VIKVGKKILIKFYFLTRCSVARLEPCHG